MEFEPPKQPLKGPGGEMVLSTRFMVAIKLYLYICLGFVCKCHVGLFLVCLFQLKTWRVLSITWTLSAFSTHLLLDIFNILTSMTTVAWNLSFFFFFYLANRDDNPRRRPSSLEPWWTECAAAPLIAVMALRAPSQTIQMLTSPSLNVHSKG